VTVRLHPDDIALVRAGADRPWLGLQVMLEEVG
jgi:hypothetical protein